MSKKTNWQRIEEARKKRQEENNSVSSTKTLSNFDKLEKSRFEKSFNTLQTDLTTLSKTIGDVYNGWQTQETMKNTLSSVQSMYDRLGKYQEYQKIYGGVDLSELHTSYKNVLDGWDGLSKLYGNYKNAEVFNSAKKTVQMDNDYTGLTFDEVQAKKKEYAKDSFEYDYFDNYTKYTDLNEFDKAIEAKKTKDNSSKFTMPDNLTLDATNKALDVNSFGKKKENTVLEEAFRVNAQKSIEGRNFAQTNDLETARNVWALDHAFDLHKDVMQNEDFAENSKYVSTRKNGRFGETYDATYEYINDVDGMRAKIDGNIPVQIGGKTLTTQSAKVSEQQAKGYDELYPEEVRVYNYWTNYDRKNRTNKAQEFLDAMEITLTKRKYDKQTQSWEDYADSGAFQSAVASVASIPASVFGSIPTAVDALKDTAQGKAYNPYGAGKMYTNFSQDTREYVGENIAEATDGMELFGQNIPSFLYSTVMSMGDSALGAATMKQFFTPLMGTNAFHQKAKELTEAGEDADTIFKTALASGVAEAVFEYISIDKLVKIKNVDSGKRLVVEALKQSGIEGSEELLTEASNIISDTLFRGDNAELIKQYNALLERGYTEKEANTEIAKQIVSQIGWAAVGGALSGLVMGGGASTSNYLGNAITGKEIKANERVSDLFDIANNPEIAEAYETYTRYANKGINTENVSNAQLGRLYNEVKADAVGKVNSKKSTDEQYAQGMATLGQLGILATENKLAKSAKENAKDLKVGEKSDVDINDVKLKDNKFVVSTDKGEVSVNDVNVSKREAELLGIAKEIAKTEGEELANAFIAQYDGETDIYAYHNSFNVTMAYAKGKYSYDYILNNKGVLSVQAIKEIYKETRIKADKEQKAKFQELVKQMADKKFYKGFIDESAIDYDNTSAEGKVNWKDLTQKQREAVTFVKGFAQATGMNLVFVANNPEYNGKYDRTYNTLTINLDKGGYDAIRNIKETIIPTMSHETTHWMKEKSPELWRHLNEIVFSTLTEHYNSNTEQAIKDKIELLDRLDPKIKHTEEDARERNITEKDLIQAEMNRKKDNTEDISREEIIARACEDLLKMSEQGRKIFSSLSEGEQKTLFEKVKAIITDLMNWVNDLLNSYESTSTEARIMREYKEQLQKASKVWDKMLEDSVKVNQALEKSGAFEHNGADNASVFSEKEIIGVSGKSYGVGVYLDSNLLTGLTEDERKGMVKEYVTTELAGEHFVAYDSNKDAVDVRIATKSESFKNEKGKKRNVLKELYNKYNGFTIKQEAVVLIDELIANAKFESPSQAKHKHGWLDNNGKNDWDIWTVFIQEKNKSVWEATLNIANTTNGEKILYDIGPIKMVEQASKSAKSTTNNIILNSDKNVNTKFSNKDSEGNTLTEAQAEFFKDSKIRVSEVEGWKNTITENGALFPVYHGTNSDEFYEFDKASIGSANDRGWFGKGFYFAFTEDEASYYGNRVLKCYLNVKKPFIYSEEMETFDGQTTGDVNFDFASFIINVADKFPEIAKKVYVDVAERNSDEIVEKSFADFAKEIKAMYYGDRLSVVEVDDRGEKIYQYRYSRDVDSIDAKENIKNIIKTHYVDSEWVADFLKEKGTITETEYDKILDVLGKYDSKQLRDAWLYTRFNSREQAEKNRLSAAVLYLREHKYSYIDQHMPHYYMMHFIGDSLTEEIRKRGYDGVLQSRYGDEVVVFNSNQIKLTTNTNPTSNLDMRYSDKEQPSIYDLMGENERLLKENEKYKADVERLKERLKIEKTLTHGNRFNENQLGMVAGHLRNISNSTYDKLTLMRELKDVYSYIITSEALAWEDIFGRCYRVAENMLKESKPEKVIDDYSKHILRNIRSTKIRLSDVQKAEAQHIFGKNWNRYFFNRVVITDSGTPIDMQWSEWADMYPDLFDRNISDTDMIGELYDIIGSLQDASEIVMEYDGKERTRWLAREIYNQYWNVSTIKTTADKYDRKIKELNHAHYNAMVELRDDYNNRLEEQKKLYKQKNRELVAKIRERKDKEIAMAKQHGRDMMNKYKENAERKTRIQRITANTLSLNELLIKNSKEKHVPEVMKPVVVELIKAIDFSSKQLLGMDGTRKDRRGTPTQNDISLSKALSKVKDMLGSEYLAKNGLVELYGHELGEDLEALVDSVNDAMRTVGDNEFVLNKMSLAELKTLEKVVGTIKHAVSKMNEFHTVHHAKGIANLSQKTMEYLDSLGQAKVFQGLRGGVEKLLNWGNGLPYYVFKRFGEGGTKIFEAFQDGWDKFAFHIKKIIDYANESYTSKEAEDWTKEIHTFEFSMPISEAEKESENYKPQYQKVQMTIPQMMSLYCLQKREQAKNHILGGGIRIADIVDTKGNVIAQSEGIILDAEDVSNIVNTLTDRQKEVADKLQSFMNTVCTDWGNEVSMLRFGYKAFGEENYFPIQSDKNNLAVNDETEQNNSLFKLLNMSFTKTTVDKANNRIVISDIFDVFAQHTSDMAKYNALALPVLDAFKWYNYTEKEYKDDTRFITSGVKQSLENAFGKDAQNYITTFLKDINGEKEVSRDTLGKHFFTNAKIAAVGGNIRVALLQPTSYVRASAVIDNKYLVKALTHKPKIDKAIEHCGMALWKSMGYYDTNIQKGVEEQIKHTETAKDKLVELSMKGAEWGDKITWGYLWNACELEIRETRNDLKVGSSEFYGAIGKRLREIIYATQVVDSTMTRSQMMRSSQTYDKMLIAFASEPTLAYNMVQDAIISCQLDAKRLGKKESFKKNGKKVARVFIAYTMTNAVAALVESGFDAFRDDDDEEMDLIEFMKLYLSNFAYDMSFTAKIPYIKELVSILQGYTTSRTDTQWMQSLGYTLKGITKIAQGEGNAHTTFKNLLRSMSYLSGLPFYNVYRDTIASFTNIDLFTTEELEEWFNDLFN